MEFANIKYNGDVSKFIEAEDDPYACISFYKDTDYFQDEVAYSKFVKQCESMIRTSKDYKIFISYIKNILGINFCQVSSKIYDTDATIEMHHGPIFTLFDITSVILNYFMKTGKKINSFRITDAVLQEHFELRVQVVMLAITNHEAAHNRDLFLHVNQGIGNLTEFICMYRDCLDDIHKYKIWNYINMCKSNPSFDRGYLDVDHIEKMIKL